MKTASYEIFLSLLAIQKLNKNLNEYDTIYF